MLEFPCNVQSYDDITGVWGNVVLVKKMDISWNSWIMRKQIMSMFRRAIRVEENRSYTLVRDLIQWGKLIPVCYDNGNLLASVDVNGDYGERSAQALTEFEQCYIKKEANEMQ